MSIYCQVGVTYGASSCFDVFLWSSPSTCLPICLRLRNTVQIVVFVREPLLETIALYGKTAIAIEVFIEAAHFGMCGARHYVGFLFDKWRFLRQSRVISKMTLLIQKKNATAARTK